MSKKAIIAKLKDGIDQIKPVEIDGLTYGLKPIRQTHYHEASMRVSDYYQQKGISVGMQNIDQFDFDKEDLYLLMTVVDPETGEPVFEDVQQLRELLHKDLKAELLAQAEQYQEECSPDIEQYTPEELEELVEQVKKTPNPTSLNGLDLRTLKRLVLILANQQKTSQTDK